MTRKLVLVLSMLATVQATAHAAESNARARTKAYIATIKDRAQGRQRLSAIYQLAELGRDAYEAVPFLVQLIRNPAKDTKSIDREAIRALAYLGPAATPAIPALIARLDPKLPNYRDAEQTLGAIGEPAVKPLLRRLAHKDAGIRGSACRALSHMRPLSKIALKPLVILLRGNQRNDVKCAAISALGMTGSDAKPALPTLCAFLRDNNIDLRRAAIVALGKMGSAAKRAGGFVTQSLRDKNPYARSLAVAALFRISPSRKTAAVVRNAITRSNDHNMKTTSLRGLEGMGQDIYLLFPFLVKCLKEKYLGRPAAELLCEMRTERPEEIKLLKAALEAALIAESTELARQLRVVLAVNGVDAGETAKTLAGRLRFHDVRKEACKNLVRIGSPAVPTLAGHLSSEMYTGTLMAKGLVVKILGEIGPGAKEALPALRKAYEKRDKTAKYSWTDFIPDTIEQIEAKAGK